MEKLYNLSAVSGNEAKIFAAIMLMGSNGVLTIRVADLAMELGMDKKNIYREFRKPPQLFTAILNDGVVTLTIKSIDTNIDTTSSLQPVEIAECQETDVDTTFEPAFNMTELEKLIDKKVEEKINTILDRLQVGTGVDTTQTVEPVEVEPDVQTKVDTTIDTKEVQQETKQVKYWKNMIIDTVTDYDTGYEKRNDIGKYCSLVNCSKRNGWSLETIKEHCTETYSMLERLGKLEQFVTDVKPKLKRGGLMPLCGLVIVSS